MWLSQRVAAEEPPETRFARGKVTISGTQLSVDADGELRAVEILSPAGISWRPSGGADVLVMKTDGGSAVIAAAPAAQADELSFKAGGAEIVLNQDGILLKFGAQYIRLTAEGISTTMA